MLLPSAAISKGMMQGADLELAARAAAIEEPRALAMLDASQE